MLFDEKSLNFFLKKGREKKTQLLFHVVLEKFEERNF